MPNDPALATLPLQTCNGWTRPELLRLLGSAERGSSHPLAAAVLGYAAAQVGSAPEPHRCRACSARS